MLLHRQRLPSLFAGHSRRRSSSTLSERLESALKSRSLPVLYDYLVPQSSHLLTTTLVTYLPFLSASTPTHLPSVTSPTSLPPAHHLVYFPTPTTPSSLLPDGTDTLHSPGEPFTHRLWAGGHIRFPPSGGPLLNGTRAALVERIRHVHTSGPPGSEKVFVGIERRVVAAPVRHDGGGEEEEEADDHHIRSRFFCEEPDGTDQEDDSTLMERRDLCFLRPQNSNLQQHPNTADATPSAPPSPSPPPPAPLPTPHQRRPLKPSTNPQFTYPLTPDPILLFRFSALTYNAHAIHLDPLYTRTVYHQPALLVHGPLLLTLMLTCLEHELGKSAATGARRVIREIRYRCLAPVYVGDEIRVCGRKAGKSADGAGGKGTADEEHEWEVWVEKGGDAGALLPLPPALVVRGTVRTGVSGRGSVGAGEDN